MLSVTDQALRALNDSLNAQENRRADDCFRIVPGDNGSLRIALQTPAADDTTFDFDGQAVLALPDALRGTCERRTIDLDEQGQLVMS